MKLTDREWKEFWLTDFFDVELSKGDNQAKLLQQGYYPLVSAGSLNNGICKYILEGDGKSERFSSNVLTIDMFGKVFYQPASFYAVSHGRVNILKPKFTTSKTLGLFLVATIEKRFEGKYSFAVMCNQSRLQREKLLFPTTQNGQPDYQFMEDYVKEIMHRKRQEYIDYAQKILAGGGKQILIKPLIGKKWKAFKISDIFEIFAGKRLENKNQIIGNIPFIGATDSNNGITNFVSNKNASFDNNVLGINYNGSVCEAFYHPYKCIFSDDVKRLHLKNYRNTENLLLFFSSIIKKQKEKYRYAYKFNTERMRKQYIMLPVDDKGNPDYEYMEYYTQNKMLAKYKDYLQYMECVSNMSSRVLNPFGSRI